MCIRDRNKRLKAAVENAETGKGATVFGYYVDDPERFGLSLIHI